MTGLSLAKLFSKYGDSRVGPELHHPARDVDGTRDLAALLDLGGITHVDDQGAVGYLLFRLLDRDARHDLIGGFH